MTDLSTINELLEANEDEHTQFKEAKNDFDSGEAAKCCCALSNGGGGRLVLGISDKRPRKVVGSQAFPQPERKLPLNIVLLNLLVPQIKGKKSDKGSFRATTAYGNLSI